MSSGWLRTALRRVWPFGGRHEGDRLSALLDDELDDDDALEVTRHLAGCEECFAEFEAIREACRALRGLPRVEPPDDLYEDVLARAPMVAEADGSRRALRAAAAVVASLLLVSAAAFLAGNDQGGTVSPPVEMFVVDHVARVEGGPNLTTVDLGR